MAIDSATTDKIQKPHVYVSSQLGFSEVGRHSLYEIIHDKLEKAGLLPLDPFKTCGDTIDFQRLKKLEEEGTYKQVILFWEKFNENVTHINNNLMEKAHCMALILDGGHAADDGASAELGYFVGKFPNKPVFALRTDIRCADNPATRINAQLLGYIKRRGVPGGLYYSVDSWAAAIEEWAKEVFNPKQNELQTV